MNADRTTKKKSQGRRKKRPNTNEQKKKNPLYVVTNNGKDVEEATGPLDALVKRLGLGPTLTMFRNLIEMLLSQVESYPMFLAVKKFIDQLVEALDEFSKRWFPQWHFYR